MQNKVKIIAGKWRGTNLTFADADGVRPTNIRLRETLFNWLAPFIANAKCLDLFAGSGALGIEALSRGAASCVFVDILKQNIQNLKQLKSKLNSESIILHNLDYADFLQKTTDEFSIIFLDAPFNCDLLQQSLQKLSELDFLQAKLIYVETPKRHSLFLLNLPKNFKIEKKAQIGDSLGILLGRTN